MATKVKAQPGPIDPPFHTSAAAQRVYEVQQLTSSPGSHAWPTCPRLNAAWWALVGSRAQEVVLVTTAADATPALPIRENSATASRNPPALLGLARQADWPSLVARWRR